MKPGTHTNRFEPSKFHGHMCAFVPYKLESQDSMNVEYEVTEFICPHCGETMEVDE